MRLLVVDDEKELVHTLLERLEFRGVDAKGIFGGEDALRLLEQEEFDVILVDVKMPGMGGLEVLQEIKRRRPDQRVVLLTGHGSKHNAKAGLQLGAFDYLMKPVKIERLLAILKDAMSASDGDTE